MIIRFLFCSNLKTLTKSIEQFKQFRDMSKLEARNSNQFQYALNNLLDHLKQQSPKEKKLINISEKIEKKVFYYLSDDEQEEIYKIFSQFYFCNLEISKIKQFAIIIRYTHHLNNIFQLALKHPLDQTEIFDLISAINYKNSWSQVEHIHIQQFKSQLDKIQTDDQEIDFNLFNELIISSQSINIESMIRRNLKSKKINKLFRQSTPITISHVNIINRILGDQLMSHSLWKLYQEDILKLDLTTLTQQQFVYDHLRRNYQLNQQNQSKCDHPSLKPDRLPNLYKNELILEIEKNLQYINPINSENKFSDFTIEDFSKLNSLILKIKYDKSNDQFIYSYLSALKDEVNFYLEQNIYNATENFNHFLEILNSLDGMYGLKIQKKQENPVAEIYRIIEEKIFKIICKNNYEIDLNEDQDPFAVDLLKISKQKSGKWKEEDDQVKIQISELETEQIYQIYQLALLFNKNQKGRLYFHYCITKQLAQNIKKLDFTKQCDILQYLSQIDKLFMLKDYTVDYNQLEQLNGLEQTKCAAQLLYYNQISFNIEKTVIGNLIDILQKNFHLLPKLEKSCQVSLYLAYELLRLEFPSIEAQPLPEVLKQTFDDYWAYLQKESEAIVSDTKAFMDKLQYHYTYNCQVSIWKFLYVFEQDKVVVICLSNRFYLGTTNQNLIEINILKRAMRLIDYKLRILDRHEYSKLPTRHDKNNYIYEKLKSLSKEPKQPKKPYFNV